MLYPLKDTLFLYVSTQMEKKYVITDSLKFSSTDSVVLKFIVDKIRYHSIEKNDRFHAVDLYLGNAFDSLGFSNLRLLTNG